jgi:hypothetical protein
MLLERNQPIPNPQIQPPQTIQNNQYVNGIITGTVLTGGVVACAFAINFLIQSQTTPVIQTSNSARYTDITGTLLNEVLISISLNPIVRQIITPIQPYLRKLIPTTQNPVGDFLRTSIFVVIAATLRRASLYPLQVVEDLVRR